FEDRIDGVVSYDVLYDLHDAMARSAGPIAFRIQRMGFGKLMDAWAGVMSRFDPGIRWALHNARWVFGSEGLTGLLNVSKAYTLSCIAPRINQHVLILAGAEDDLVPLDHVEKFKQELVNARSVTTKVYDASTGGHEHSQLGATTLWQGDFFDWI